MKPSSLFRSLVLLLAIALPLAAAAQITPKVRPVAPVANNAGTQPMTLEQKRMMETEDKINALIAASKAQQQEINALKTQVAQLSTELAQTKQSHTDLQTKFAAHFHRLSNLAVMGNTITNNAVMTKTYGGIGMSQLQSDLRKTGTPEQ